MELFLSMVNIVTLIVLIVIIRRVGNVFHLLLKFRDYFTVLQEAQSKYQVDMIILNNRMEDLLKKTSSGTDVVNDNIFEIKTLLSALSQNSKKNNKKIARKKK